MGTWNRSYSDLVYSRLLIFTTVTVGHALLHDTVGEVWEIAQEIVRQEYTDIVEEYEKTGKQYFGP